MKTLKTIIQRLLASSLKVKAVSIAAFVTAVTAVTLIIITAVSSSQANKAAEEFTEACRNGDVSAMEAFLPGSYDGLPEDIQKLIAETEEEDGNEDEEKEVGSSESDDNDLLSLILLHSEIERSSVITLDGEATLKLRIYGPDMARIFNAVNDRYLSDPDGDKKADSGTLYAEVQELIESGKYTYSHTAELPMDRSGGKWRIDFRQPGCMDALTGGLQTAYSELYLKAFNELMEYYLTNEKEVDNNED